MKTVLIYDQMGEQEIQFAIVDGDWTRFNNTYVNTMTDLATELCSLLYPNPEGDISIDLVEDFPIDAILSGAKVATIGFLP